jgi:hypothetical protein
MQIFILVYYLLCFTMETGNMCRNGRISAKWRGCADLVLANVQQVTYGRREDSKQERANDSGRCFGSIAIH